MPAPLSLAAGLRGRGPSDFAAPRVLDILLFRGVRTPVGPRGTASPAGGGLAWRSVSAEVEREPQAAAVGTLTSLPEPVGPGVPAGIRPVAAGVESPPSQVSTTAAEPIRPFGPAPPAAASAPDRPAALHYRFPPVAVPGGAAAEALPPGGRSAALGEDGEVERRRGGLVREPAPPDSAPAGELPGGRAPALPYAAVGGWVPSPEALLTAAEAPPVHRDAGSPAGAEPPRTPGADMGSWRWPPRDLPWSEPGVTGAEAATRGQQPPPLPALPYAPSPDRSAAELVERVTRTLVARRDVRVEVEPRPRRAQRPAQRELPELAGERALTSDALLREVTRDDVVRALVNRMRALTREERFRLGQIR